MKIGQNEVRVKIPVRSRGWMLKNRGSRMSRQFSEDNIKETAETTSNNKSGSISEGPGGGSDELQYIIQKGNISSLNRFLLLSYFPSGFWPRLISRILADDRIVEIVRNYFNVPPPSEITSEVVELLDHKAEWCCWQSGMELTYGDLMLMRVKEVTGEKPFSFMLRRDDGALCESEIIDKNSSSNNELSLFREDDNEQTWDAVDLNETGLLEIHLPAFSVVVNSQDQISYAGTDSTRQFKKILLEPSVESLAKLLALIVDHVDTLLEDWYPSIGTRFVHTSEGKYLVTRLIPCPKCFPSEEMRSISSKDALSYDSSLSNHHSPKRHSSGSSKSNEFSTKFPFSFSNSKSPRMSSDSGVGYSPSNTRVSSVDSNSDLKESSGAGESSFQDLNSAVKIRTGVISQSDSVKFHAGGGDSTNYSGLNFFLKGSPGLTGFAKNFSMYSWSVEYCILHSQKYAEYQHSTLSASGRNGSNQLVEERQLSVKCPKHGDILLKEICPDVLFLDLNSRYLLQNPCVQRGNLLGRGAFGFVFGGKLVPKYESKMLEIAIKMFQPIDPGHDNAEAQAAYKIAKSKWFRAPAQSACRAYVAARGEVRVLYWVSHPNIVPFVGLCQSPLSIVMPRAPKGALDSVLSDYRRSGDKVSSETLRVTILQVGKALEYLHSHRIIYRDLKSENVLVWCFPPPFSKFEDRSKVDVKLADYGISRSSFPTGSKGFGGTEGFMAPEIIRYNGEEEYTEKVDIFSFGMLVYELVSLKQPFDGCENVKENILEGLRPCLTRRDCELYSLYILDLMVVCWSHVAKDRPTASQVVTITTGPEFTFLRDVVSLANVTNVVSAIGLQYGVDKEIWASCSTGGIYCLKLKSCTSFESCLCFEFISGVVTAMCHVEDTVWMGDTLGKIHVLRISDYNKIVESDLESQVGYCGAIVSIQNLDVVVAVAVTTGRLFLCDKKNVQLLTELGKSTVIHCLNSRFIADGTIELWAGERAGQMTIFSIRDGTVVSQEIINHYEPIIEAVEVLLIDAHVGNDTLFSYVYPGSVIYGWDCDKREMVARLDVGKLLPVRESMEEELNNKPLQVTVLKSTISEVYIGTNWGFVFVADTKYLRPITSFRPFTEDVRSFWVFRQMQTFSTMLNLASAANSADSTNNASDSDIDNSSFTSVTSEAGSFKAGDISSLQDINSIGIRDSSNKVSSEIRGDSPIPGSGNSFKGSSSNSTNAQLVVGIGKGFSHLIEKNICYGSGAKIGVKQRRRAFALLWHVKRSWE